MRSGTSIGANIEEAIASQTKKDFLAKMHIAMKEAREIHYWLRLIAGAALMRSGVIVLLQECSELISLLSSITLTTRQNIHARRMDALREARHSFISQSTFLIGAEVVWLP